MPLNKKQIQRFVKFVSLMKQHKYPNAKSFSEILRKADLYGNENIACTPKTVSRDIKTLRDEYGAPIVFNKEYNGFELKYGWDLEFPVLQDEAMLASMLGAKLAQDLMPEPVKTQITNALDQELSTNDPDFLDTAYIDSLIAASGVKVKIVPDIFKTLFDAWQEHEAVDIVYETTDGKKSERRIEPHVLTYYNSAWYIKGFCLKQNDVRVFAIHRIVEAELTGKYYESDPLIIKEAQNGHIFEYKTIENIEIKCSKAIAGYIDEQHEFYDEDIVEHDDGSVTVHIPAAPEHEIIKWVLSEAGNAKVIKPANLAEKIIKAAKRVTEVNS